MIDIGQYIVGKSDDEIEGVSWYPQIEEMDKLLLTAMECLVIASNSINQLFKLGITKAVIDTGILLVIIYTQVLNTLDIIIRTVTQNQILVGLIFMGTIGLFLFIVGIPFNIYYTFVIEKKYGFNKTTKKTFIYDLVKSIVGYALIGAVGLSIILFFFDRMGSMAWFYCWLAASVIQVFTLFIYPVFILPVFNKLKILKDGELKEAIQKYLEKQGVNINMNNIRIMDSSKRTKKSNAFLSGIGRNKRLVLSDTLLKKHSIDEILSIVAHEVGHYKKSHILKKLGTYIAESFLMFYILSILIQNTNFFLATILSLLSFLYFLSYSFFLSLLFSLYSIPSSLFL